MRKVGAENTDRIESETIQHDGGRYTDPLRRLHPAINNHSRRRGQAGAHWPVTTDEESAADYNRQRKPSHTQLYPGPCRARHTSAPQVIIQPYGSANATYVSLDFDPSLPPPAAITTNCFPLTAYVLGVA